MHKYVTVFITLFLSSFVSSSSIAIDREKFYIGFDSGYGTLDGVCVNPFNPIIIDFICDEVTYSLMGKAGYFFTEKFGVEGFYGLAIPIDAEIRFRGTGAPPIDSRVEFFTYGVVGVGRYEIQENIYLTGKLDIHNWDQQVSSHATGYNAQGDGIDLVLGVGGSYKTLPNFSVSGGYDIFFGDDTDFKLFNLGLSYNF